MTRRTDAHLFVGNVVDGIFNRLRIQEMLSARRDVLNTRMQTYIEVVIGIAQGRPGTVLLPPHLYSRMWEIQNEIDACSPLKPIAGQRDLSVMIAEGDIRIVPLRDGTLTARWEPATIKR